MEKIKKERLTLKAKDGFPIVAHLFHPIYSNHKILLINSATGVKQEFYFHFAMFLAKHGFTVLTYDYRGIGQSKPYSMKHFQATMRDWGKLDYPCLTQYLLNNFPEEEKFLLGHSIGALVLGLNPDSFQFKKFIFVSTQSSYFRRLHFKTQLEGLFGFGLLLPLTNFLYGYFPANYFGLGESLPKGAAMDWRKMILHPDSINALLNQEKDISNQLTQNILVLRSEDDDWLTKAGERELFSSTYSQMKPVYRLLLKNESPENHIGHVDFFRHYNQPIWNIVLKELV